MHKKSTREKKESYLPGIKALIFDGGGTIWDSSESLYESYLWGFRQLGLTLRLSPRTCHHLRGLRDFNTGLGIAKALLWASNAFSGRESPFFLQRPKANEYLRQKVENLNREDHSFLSLAKELAQLFDEYLYNRVRGDSYTLLPHAAGILKKLQMKGYYLALVTIRRSVSAKHILTHHGLQRCFSHILSTEGFGEGGKVGGVAEEIMNRLMMPPSHILWIGDTGADVSCAKNAGMFAVGVLTGLANRQTLMDEDADSILDDLSGLANLLGIEYL